MQTVSEFDGQAFKKEIQEMFNRSQKKVPGFWKKVTEFCRDDVTIKQFVQDKLFPAITQYEMTKGTTQEAANKKILNSYIDEGINQFWSGKLPFTTPFFATEFSDILMKWQKRLKGTGSGVSREMSEVSPEAQGERPPF